MITRQFLISLILLQFSCLGAMAQENSGASELNSVQTEAEKPGFFKRLFGSKEDKDEEYRKLLESFESLEQATEQEELEQKGQALNEYHSGSRELLINKYVKQSGKTEAQWSSDEGLSTSTTKKTKATLSHEVYGFHAFWHGESYKAYPFQLLSRVAYIGYFVDPLTGAPTHIENWSNTKLLEVGQEENPSLKMDLTVLLHGEKNLHNFFTNPSAQEALTKNVIKAVALKRAHGVCFDFAGLDPVDSDLLVSFLRAFSSEFYNSNPNYQITLCLPSQDPERAYAISELSTLVDRFVIFAFDYYDKNSQVAGPMSPLTSVKPVVYSIDHTFNLYTNKGLRKEQMVLCFATYGQLYETENEQVYSKVKSFVEPVEQLHVEQRYKWKHKSTLVLPALSQNISFQRNGSWYQLWFEDAKSLTYKFQYAKHKNIHGIGLWGLGGSSYEDIWSTVHAFFTVNGSIASQSEIIPINYDSLLAQQVPTRVIQPVEIEEFIHWETGDGGSFEIPDFFGSDSSESITEADNVFAPPVALRALLLFFGIVAVFMFIGALLSMFRFNVKSGMNQRKTTMLFIAILGGIVTYLLYLASIISMPLASFIGGTLLGLVIYWISKNENTYHSESGP